MMNPPRIGIGVFVARADGKREYVIGKRKGSHGAGRPIVPLVPFLLTKTLTEIQAHTPYQAAISSTARPSSNALLAKSWKRPVWSFTTSAS